VLGLYKEIVDEQGEFKMRCGLENRVKEGQDRTGGVRGKVSEPVAKPTD
jgi:hypothetical protein